jgi:hypothetical protein
MKNALRELRELDRLLRCATPSAMNIGSYVAARAEMLAPLLRCSAETLWQMRDRADDEVAPGLSALVKAAVLRERDGVQVHRRERAHQAASAIGASARQTDGGYAVDTDLLLGELLVDTSRKYIALQGDGVHVVLERQMLAKAAWLRRLHLDVAARVHEHALQLRWRAGKGGLNLRSVTVPNAEAGRVLMVTLEARRPSPTERPRGAWLGEIIRDMGFVT